MAPRLKAFQWSDGFHAFTVAVSSRPKALAAWGVSQDLFATGLAKQIDEGPDYDAAIKSPGRVIERGLTIDVGKTSTRPAARPNDKARQKLKAAQAELEEWQAQAEAEQADLDARIAALDADRKAMTQRHEAEHERLKARIAALRKDVGTQAGKTEP